MPTQATCTVIGHLYGPATEIKSSGERIGAKCNFYTKTRVKNGQEWIDEFTSHNATVWGKQAEWLLRDGAKGTLVSASGTFRIRKWEKDGKHGAATEIEAHNLIILERKEASTEESPSPAPAQPRPQRPVDAAIGGGAGSDEEAPF